MMGRIPTLTNQGWGTLGVEQLKARVSRPGRDKFRPANTRLDYRSVHFLFN
jgi:hypothetical protein